MQLQKLFEKLCLWYYLSTNNNERQRLEEKIGEQNSINLPSSVCAATFSSHQRTSLPTVTPEQDWILR